LSGRVWARVRGGGGWWGQRGWKGEQIVIVVNGYGGLVAMMRAEWMLLIMVMSGIYEAGTTGIPDIIKGRLRCWWSIHHDTSSIRLSLTLGQ
jgi:hypothetical protein